MSLVAIYSVFCNGDGCVRWVGEARTAREARNFARRSGWTRIVGRQHGGKHNGGRDLCPDCAATTLEADRADPAG